MEYNENKQCMKRKRFISANDEGQPIKQHKDKRICETEFKSDFSDKLNSADQTHRSLPLHLIKFMYRLDLSVLCLQRLYLYKDRYPSLSIVFGDSTNESFNDIVLNNNKKSVHIQIENVDSYYAENKISYSTLFADEKHTFSIQKYFDNFVKLLISKPDSNPLKNILCLIVFTNSSLDLTEENKLKQEQYKTFYPFQFDKIDIKKINMFKDILLLNNEKESSYYQFSKKNSTQDELLRRLEFSSALLSALKERQFSQNKVKQLFSNILLFAVNQSNRKMLNSCVMIDLENIIYHGECHYMELQTEVMNRLIAPKSREMQYYRILYSFNVILFFLNLMYLHSKIFSINIAMYQSSVVDGITICYENKNIYIAICSLSKKIGYSELFLSEGEEIFINKHFALFIKELNFDVKYFIIFASADLALTKENMLKQDKSKNFYPLKFHAVDSREKMYETLENFACNSCCFYQFSHEERTRNELMNLLKFPPIFFKEHNNENLCLIEKEIKEIFLDKLVFIVNQPNLKTMNSFIKNEIFYSKVPYSLKELQEITLRWLESHETSAITKEKMEFHLKDIQTIDKENGINFFRDIYYFCFDNMGNERQYLKALETERICLSNIYYILRGSKSPKVFSNLLSLWFNSLGNKTHHVKVLEGEKISLSKVCNILYGAGEKAPKVFKDLYHLWFDKLGNKTKCLVALEREGLSLSTICDILIGKGAEAPKSFKELYNLLFKATGCKTAYLKTYKKEGLDLATICYLLNGIKSPKEFKDFYHLYYNKQGESKSLLAETGSHITDFFPFRRSKRKSIVCKMTERNKIFETILSGKEEGFEIKEFPNKGRGIVTTKAVSRGDFVLEYSGELIYNKEAKRREALYELEENVGCYMYYFEFRNKKYCIDATKDTGNLGRLVNHSKKGNLITRIIPIQDIPHLVFFASRDIDIGEELCYDYGDNRKIAVELYPWLAT